LNFAYEIQQARAVDQLNGLPFSEVRRITRELTNADDLDAIGVVVRDETPHLSDDRHLYLPRPPLLALDKFSAAVLSQDQVNPTICATQAGLLNLITAPAESFSNEHFEFAPAHRCDAVEASLRIEQNFAAS
jgi:hypothetical protein